MTVVHPSEFLPFVTSAPGKVIIFGEHSAVYNRPAIAASVSSLRTYLLVTKSDEPGSIRMDFPDINFSSSWSHQDLSAVSKDILSKSFETNELQPDLIEFLKLPLSQLKDPLTRHAALCFLYLYMCLCPDLTGVRFILKSTLPIGAGLGSSASTAVCLALAMGKLGGHIEINNKSLSAADLTFVNKWSLVGEKCIHGTPSGIDNAVATYGNAVLFRRQEDGTTNFELLRDFPQLPIILTNTKIPKSTHVLVSNVRKLVDQQPSITTCLLDAMAETANRAKTILLDLQSDSSMYKELLELVRVNHGLLVSLGVSHPGLEVIRSLSETLNVGATKLTGAGGGGCALTVLHRDADKQQLKTFIDSLHKLHGYESFTTDLGGMGCCYLARESMTYYQAEITKAFEEKNTTEELSSVLQPEGDAFVWIHG